MIKKAEQKIKAAGTNIIKGFITLCEEGEYDRAEAAVSELIAFMYEVKNDIKRLREDAKPRNNQLSN